MTNHSGGHCTRQQRSPNSLYRVDTSQLILWSQYLPNRPLVGRPVLDYTNAVMYVIPLVFPKFCLLLGDVPTTRKVFHRSHVASRQYLALPHWPLFRAEKKGAPVPG